jgi:hypothetical protein
VPGWWLSSARLLPVPEEWGSSFPHGAAARQGLMGMGNPRGGGPIVPHRWGSAGPEGQWAWRRGLVSWQAIGPAPGWGLAQTGGGDPSGHGYGTEGQVFQHGVGPEAGGQSG